MLHAVTSATISVGKFNFAKTLENTYIYKNRCAICAIICAIYVLMYFQIAQLNILYENKS